MIRTAMLSCFLVLTLAQAARADIPLPFYNSYVKPWVRFEGIEDHPDHVFYLRFLTFSGGPSGLPHQLIEIKNSDAFDPHLQRRISDMSLLVMSRSEFAKRASEDASLLWLNKETDGALNLPLLPPATVAWIISDSTPVTTYRVSLSGRRPSVEKLAPEWTWLQLSIGGAAAISLTLLGIWLFRRRKVASPQLT
jgi:hypothetical protein